jgi:hypothetical protein
MHVHASITDCRTLAAEGAWKKEFGENPRAALCPRQQSRLPDDGGVDLIPVSGLPLWTRSFVRDAPETRVESG